jgi:hypothetical protein
MAIQIKTIVTTTNSQAIQWKTVGNYKLKEQQ